MAARSLNPKPAALALMAALLIAPSPAAWPAAEQKKVWRALDEQVPRSARSAPVTPPRAAKSSKEPFPSEIALALVVGGVIAAILAASALQARRRAAQPVLPEPRDPQEPEGGSPVEQLWRTHLGRRRPKGGDTV